MRVRVTLANSAKASAPAGFLEHWETLRAMTADRAVDSPQRILRQGSLRDVDPAQSFQDGGHLPLWNPLARVQRMRRRQHPRSQPMRCRAVLVGG